MESSDNLASRHNTLLITDNTIPWLTFLFYGRGVNILWYNIMTPPPLQKIFKNSIL